MTTSENYSTNIGLALNYQIVKDTLTGSAGERFSYEGLSRSPGASLLLSASSPGKGPSNRILLLLAAYSQEI